LSGASLEIIELHDVDVGFAPQPKWAL